jgi:hypothetical protein
LVSLNLSQNRLGHRLRNGKWELDATGITRLSEMIEGKTGGKKTQKGTGLLLTELDISHNNLGYESARRIGKAIYQNTTLQRVNVTNNGE